MYYKQLSYIVFFPYYPPKTPVDFYCPIFYQNQYNFFQVHSLKNQIDRSAPIWSHLADFPLYKYSKHFSS